MSTFNGIVPEFPDIRIDFFRQNPQACPPLAVFLSHVHTDHLAGLETLKSPFIYCSPVTKEILLRLEKYPHRMNFELGTLESRKQTYKHLNKLLKPIPLDTPTKIELEPGNVITVTLFDANHCPGAVMFLIENDEKSILYTGDVRSDSEFLSSLSRNPFLIEYTSGLKTLDCIYLDTSNTEDYDINSKADGLKELLKKVNEYPSDTVFHFSAWTYGYEEVWMALSKALNSQIHIDRYRMRIYKSLVGRPGDKISTTGPFISREGPALAGYQCGNVKQDGCLTENPDVRIHSCVKGLPCPLVNHSNPKIVWITPIVRRSIFGEEFEEVGIAEGGGDLAQRPMLEISSSGDIDDLLGLLEDIDEETKEKLRQKLHASLLSFKMAIPLDDLGLAGLNRNENEMPLSNFAKLVTKSLSKEEGVEETGPTTGLPALLPKRITFPYSRHSSLPELCNLIKAFRPKDVFPCTVDEFHWNETVSIKTRFGKYCSDKIFRHDREMRLLHARNVRQTLGEKTHTTTSGEESVAESSQVDESAQTKVSVHDAHSQPLEPHRIQGVSSHVSPPPEIISRSPGSQSQGLRRKLILQDLEEPNTNTVKRVCLTETNDSGSSPLGSKIGLLPSSSREDANSSSSLTGHNPPQPDEYEETSEANKPEASSTQWKSRSFYDLQDHVIRCARCGHELQSTYFKICAHCDDDDLHDPYFEVLDPYEGRGLEFVRQVEDNEFMTGLDRLLYIGDYLDADRSAYDSFDDDSSFNEEYEIDSFIDDDPVDPIESEGEESPDHWKRKFEELQTENEELLAESEELQADYEAVLSEKEDLWRIHRVTLSSFEDFQERYFELEDDLGLGPNSVDGNDDGQGAMIIDPAVPGLVTTDIVLSQTDDLYDSDDY